MFTIKRVEEKDLPILAQLYEQLSGAPSDFQKMKEKFSELKKNPHYYLLGAYTKENQMIGTIMGLLCIDLVMDCQPILFMENMVVDKNWHHKGAGKALLLKIEEMAKENNCLFIEYCSSLFRKEAHKFYESMGYAPDFVKGYRKFLGEKKVQQISE